MNTSVVERVSSEPSLDARPARYRIGLIALATDLTTEADFAAMRPGNDVVVHTSRVANENPVTLENLRKMAPRLTDAARLLVPGEQLDVVVYSCTSASIVIGNEVIREAIQRAKPDVACVTPTSAALCAFAALSMRSICLLTPYPEEVSIPMAEFFEAQGIEVQRHACLGIADDRDIARVTPGFVADTAEAIFDRRADGVFIACTALRAAAAVDRIESRIDAPVVTSNQAMFWNALRTAGDRRPAPGYGRLLA